MCKYSLLIALHILILCDARQRKHKELLTALTEEDFKVMHPFVAINFSNPALNNSYLSDPLFDPKGMEHLYSVTHLFLDLIQPKDPWPEELDIKLKLLEDVPTAQVTVKHDLETYKELVLRYIGFVITAFLGLLIAVVMPFAALVFCCCHICGNFSGRCDHQESDGEKCKRGGYTALLSAITVAIIFGVVCAFVTNESVSRGVKSLPENIRHGVHDASLFINNSKLEVQHLLVVNFQELQSKVENSLDRSGEIVQERLAEISKAFAVDSLTAIAGELGSMKVLLEDIVDASGKLKDDALLLKEGLRKDEFETYRLIEQCTDQTCKELSEMFEDRNLRVHTDFSQLPDVADVLENITKLIQQDIKGDVKTGQEAFHNIKQRVKQAVRNTLPQVKQAISRVGEKLQEISDSVSRRVEEIELYKINRATEELETYLSQYTDYSYYVGLGISWALLLLLLVYVLALLCGICGKRPNAIYDDDSCNKGTGANCLLCGVYLIFPMSSVILISITALFLGGGVSDRVVCASLQDPQHSNTFKHLDAALSLQRLYPQGTDINLTLSQLIVSCHQNNSLYKVLHIEKINDLTDIRNYHKTEGVDKQIGLLKTRIENASKHVKVTILSREARRKLHRLANSGISEIDFSMFTETLEENVVSYDLLNISRMLNETAEQYRGTEIGRAMMHDSIHLETQQRWVNEIKSLVRTLKARMDQLEKKIKFNQTSLREAIITLMNQTQQAQDYLADKGKGEVMLLANKFSEHLNKHVDRYAELLVESLRDKVGKCGMMSRTLNATTDSMCAHILRPLNGFWAASGWCILWFIISIGLAVSLSILYKKMDPSYGPVMDSEVMYDAYGEGDSIPLSKRWDGNEAVIPPPQYSSQPPSRAEYERPPPYYYPGPSDVK